MKRRAFRVSTKRPKEKAKKRDWVWVVNRGRSWSVVYYYLGEAKPDDSGGASPDNFIDKLHFKKLFGRLPPEGKPVKVRFSATLVEE